MSKLLLIAFVSWALFTSASPQMVVSLSDLSGNSLLESCTGNVADVKFLHGVYQRSAGRSCDG
jgi:hypothetical protein